LAKCSPRTLLATSKYWKKKKEKENRKKEKKNCLFTIGSFSSFEIYPLNIKFDYFENMGVR
jgi:hypothetical protein